ncbi:Uncharacterized protein FWK35_00020159 [Aphis craccivora]|uniref:Uncharacterized protein n=1 Tax=Aphis craccivora TaxID=307492 RepID=A0A6G0Y077_APHCR|nr:Uncharacterized protein FWK35_00020159 [Aphis craccivora]
MYKIRDMFLKNNDGSLVTSNEEILLNCDEPKEVFSFGLETWNKLVEWLKNHKAPGEDEVQAELLKNGGKKLLM